MRLWTVQGWAHGDEWTRSGEAGLAAQLKWLLWGAIVVMLSGTVIVLVGTLDPNPSVIVQMAQGVAVVALNAFPLSVGVAILKYRLYEIDRLISRTLAYVIGLAQPGVSAQQGKTGSIDRFPVVRHAECHGLADPFHG